MNVTERFINYVKIHTASIDDLTVTPTAERELDLARYLENELKTIGLENVRSDEHAYTYGEISATPGYEDKPCIGFIAHIDTIPDFSGENVKPCIIENYDGGEVVLGTSGRVITYKTCPHLPTLKGQTLITTDGTTVLGADDKAGVAEIVTACERIINEKLPHGKVAVCFAPDEEVGHGAALLDIDAFGADFAYTVDGGDISEINFETFNAAAAKWIFNGVNVHPGSAKDIMVNASQVALEAHSMLPSAERPERTENYEGFFHLTDMKGNVEKAELDYIIRDHDSAHFAIRREMMEQITDFINAKYGEGTAVLEIKEQYRNMAEKLAERMDVVELAERAIRKLGLESVRVPIRGGTDGAQLSFRGLVCPNLGTGGFAFHGPYEHITAERLETATQLVLNIIALNLE